MHHTTPLHLAKRIAQSGVCSRRAALRLVQAGRVTVNHQPPVSQYVQPQDIVCVDGTPLPAPATHQYWLYHKPIGIDCNNRPQDPQSIVHVLSTFPVRLFAVGRLDKDSRGLLLLTNDGDLAQRLLHPQYTHEKTYLVTLDKPAEPALIAAFAKGIRWTVGPHTYQAKPCKATYLNAQQLHITLTEGQHRQIRYMCRALGYKVTDLCRIAIGRLMLDNLESGQFRPLSAHELTALQGTGHSHSTPL